MRSRARRTLAVSLLVVTPALAQAGAPLTCFPMQTDAPSLPWGAGGGWNQPRADYDRGRLATDSVALLGPQVRVLERMETLRRAAIYAAADSAAAARLFAALRARAGDPESPNAEALFVFDLGYAAAAFRQARGARDSAGVPDEDGYQLIRRALVLRGTEAEIEYAAALVALGRATRGPSDKHLRIAVQGAADGSPLARTIAAHQALWGGRVEAYRTASTH